MEIIATAQGTDLGASGLLIQLGPTGLVVLLAVGAVLLLRSKAGRGAAGKVLSRAGRAVVRFVRISLWAGRLRMPLRLAYRLQPEHWQEMCAARKLAGLKRGRVKRTPMGVDVLVTLGGALTLEALTARIKDLETGLGTRRGAVRVEGRDSAHKATIRITVRNPLARMVRWIVPNGPVSIKDDARLSMNPFGEWTEIDLRQRILIVGASGSGKSSVQRVLAAPVILAVDADLEVWDLKQGTESQHYEGKAQTRITTAEQAIERLGWFMGSELPRRAAVMRRLKTSTWPTSSEHRDRIVMVDEGAALVRALEKDELARFFTFLEQARAFGIYLWWATQFPKGTNLPTELRSQMSAVIALKMRRQSESRVVFEDLTKEGWMPHRLPGKGWLQLLDDDHQDPEESRAAFITEKQFRSLPTTEGPAPTPSTPKVNLRKPPTAPQAAAEPSRAPEVKTAPVEPRRALLAALQGAGMDGVSVADLQAATGLGKSRIYELLTAVQAVKIRHGRFAAPMDKEAAA